jgi:hypothetical protein
MKIKVLVMLVMGCYQLTLVSDILLNVTLVSAAFFVHIILILLTPSYVYHRTSVLSARAQVVLRAVKGWGLAA